MFLALARAQSGCVMGGCMEQHCPQLVGMQRVLEGIGWFFSSLLFPFSPS